MSSAKFWDKIAAKYATDPISDIDAYAETLSRMQSLLKPHHRVLEIGCGTGSTALELSPLVDHYVATDISKNMIAIAEQKLADTDLAHLEFVVAEAEMLIGKDRDVIIALNLLHLLENVDAQIAQIYKALPSGGLFIAKTPLLKDGAWFLRPMIAIMRAIGKAPYVGRLGNQEFNAMLQRAGFEVTETILQTGIAPRVFTVARKP